MCMLYEASCSCGANLAGFNFKDDLMSEEVINRLYCPKCSADIRFNPETMLADNGWIIEYDIDIAKFQAQKAKGLTTITPEFIFDEGYCTWRGFYPADHIDSTVERSEISKTAKTDPRKYLENIKAWATGRMGKLSKEGWRKANETTSVSG